MWLAGVHFLHFFPPRISPFPLHEIQPTHLIRNTTSLGESTYENQNLFIYLKRHVARLFPCCKIFTQINSNVQICRNICGNFGYILGGVMSSCHVRRYVRSGSNNNNIKAANSASQTGKVREKVGLTAADTERQTCNFKCFLSVVDGRVTVWSLPSSSP